MEGEKEAWWLDDRTKRLFEQTMRLSGTLTFTVRPGTPLQLTREQARFWSCLLLPSRALKGLFSNRPCDTDSCQKPHVRSLLEAGFQYHFGQIRPQPAT